MDDYSCIVQQDWVVDASTGQELLSFKIGGNSYPVHWVNYEIGAKGAVNCTNWVTVIS